MSNSRAKTKENKHHLLFQYVMGTAGNTLFVAKAKTLVKDMFFIQ